MNRIRRSRWTKLYMRRISRLAVDLSRPHAPQENYLGPLLPTVRFLIALFRQLQVELVAHPWSLKLIMNGCYLDVLPNNENGTFPGPRPAKKLLGEQTSAEMYAEVEEKKTTPADLLQNDGADHSEDRQYSHARVFFNELPDSENPRTNTVCRVTQHTGWHPRTRWSAQSRKKKRRLGLLAHRDLSTKVLRNRRLHTRLRRTVAGPRVFLSSLWCALQPRVWPGLLWRKFVSRPQHFFSRWDFLKKASTPWKTNQAEKNKKEQGRRANFFFTRKLLSRNRKEWGRKRHSFQRRLLLRNGKERGIHVLMSASRLIPASSYLQANAMAGGKV